MPSNKISEKDLGSHVLKTSVDPDEIVGIRLDDTSKQGLKHEHVGECAKMQRSKESQTGDTKQARQAKHLAEQRKGMHQANRHHGDVFS